MKTRLILAFTGLLLGLFFGSSMGLAMGGKAHNAGIWLGLTFAVMGFLLGAKENRFWSRRKK